MECVFGLGGRNVSVGVSSPSSESIRRSRRGLRGVSSTVVQNRRFRVHRIKASVAKEENRADVKAGFADEEDYIKGGGSELYFVQMQQNKNMEMQSRISDKVNKSCNFLVFLLIIQEIVVLVIVWILLGQNQIIFEKKIE